MIHLRMHKLQREGSSNKILSFWRVLHHKEICQISNTLLDKVGCAVTGDFQMDRHCLKSTISYMVWVPLYGIQSFNSSFHHFS